MRCGRTFRLARTHPAHAQSSGSETLSRSRSLAGYTIDTHEFRFRKRQDQAFALGQLPGGLPRASDGFRLLARLAFRRFFIRPAALHLAKNALALQLLFKNPKSLIDIVVANEYLQNFSDLLLALDARQAVDGAVAVSAF